MRLNSCLTLSRSIARSTVSTMFPTPGRNVSQSLNRSNNEETSSFMLSTEQRISSKNSLFSNSLVSSRESNSAFARMAVKGRRRSWQTKAIIPPKAESRSGFGKAVCVLRKDLFRLNRAPQIACFSINAPPMAVNRRSESTLAEIEIHAFILRNSRDRPDHWATFHKPINPRDGLSGLSQCEVVRETFTQDSRSEERRV